MTNEKETHSEMVTRLAKPGDAIAATIDGPKAHLLHMVVGLAGEAAELLEGCVALEDADENGTDEEIDAAIENITEELGDIEFYAEGARQGMDFTRDEVVQQTLAVPNYYIGIEAIGIAVYAGHILDLVKKHVIYNKALPIDDIKKQFGNLEFYLEVLRKKRSLTRDAVLHHNYMKLAGGEKARYKAGYSDNAAQERADKQ